MQVDPIPTVIEKPVKSLGKWYNATLKDSEQVEQLKIELNRRQESNEKSRLSGKLNLQFGFLPRLMWPLAMYYIPIES